MKCEDAEILLCEYAEGTLGERDHAAVDEHLRGCAACAEMARDAAEALVFLAKAEDPEPPPELITKILYRTQVEPARPARVAGGGGLTERLAGLFRPILAPRFAMGMAMTILSFSMVSRIAGLPDKQPTAADFTPARVWEQLDTRAHRIWNRAVKYYENMRLVYEVRQRLDEWSAREEEERKAQSGGEILAPSGDKSTTERTEP